MSQEPEQWASAVTATNHQLPIGVAAERAGSDERMGKTDVYKQENMELTECGQWSPSCTHMATSNENEADYMERTQSGLGGEEPMEQWSPVCTHMATPDDDGQSKASGTCTHTHMKAHLIQRVSVTSYRTCPMQS